MTGRPLKIAYLCDFSPKDRNLYSGGNARIYDALCKHAGEVHILSNRWGAAEPLRRLVHMMPEAINLRARWRLHLALGRIIAREVTRELARDRYDVLFGAYSFQSLFRLQPPYPMVTAFTADATPTTYKRSEIGQSYGSLVSASRLLDPLVLKAERSIFRSQDLLLWPAAWQKESADALYGLTDAQSQVVPWGANVDDPGPGTSYPEIGPGQEIRLLFIGRDWVAKGGPLVVDVLKTLLDRGRRASLSVVGCTPPAEYLRPEVTVYPSLDKARPDQLATFQRLFRGAHFLLMASFESWGFAYCEASAYGLPSLCLKTGGVPVFDGVNGHAFAVGTPAGGFADVVESYVADPPRYRELRHSARALYERELNWDSWGQATAELLRRKLAEKGLGPR